MATRQRTGAQPGPPGVTHVWLPPAYKSAKGVAYAIILLRQQGTPVVFYPAVYEAKYKDTKDGETVCVELATIPGIETLMLVRAQLAYGHQRDYWDDAHIVGWTRQGTTAMPHSGCAVLLSNQGDGKKRMSLGIQNAGRVLKDVTGHQRHTITLDEQGEAEFTTLHQRVSVWVDEAWPAINEIEHEK